MAGFTKPAVDALIARAIDAYIASRHRRVDHFVDANFSFLASLRLHRRAIGWDLLRAPANVALVLPHLLKGVMASGLRRWGAGASGQWLDRCDLFFETAVARELVWRLQTELLELPFDDGSRRSHKDALADTLLADPHLAAALETLSATLIRRADNPETRRELKAMLDRYAGARSAAAEIVSNILLAGAGAALFQKLTPGAIALGPMLAAAVAQQAAIAAFPLGAGLGSLWYGAFAATPSAGVVAGATGALVVAAAAMAAFAGVIADPVQRSLGLHQRRLHRLIDALAAELKGRGRSDFRVRDHYAARIFDLLDVLTTVSRSVR